jgi:hypothetical protein
MLRARVLSRPFLGPVERARQGLPKSEGARHEPDAGQGGCGGTLAPQTCKTAQRTCNGLRALRGTLGTRVEWEIFAWLSVVLMANPTAIAR